MERNRLTWQDALDWLSGKKAALSAEAGAALSARHERFLADTQATLDDVWAQVGGNTWQVTDVGYPVRLNMLMNGLQAAIGSYAADVAGLARSYGSRSWWVGYVGQAWLLAAQLPDAILSLPGRSPDAIQAAVSGAIEGVDLAAAIENMRFDFMQRARREMILSQAAGESYHKARKRLMNVAGVTEAVERKEELQEAARKKAHVRLAGIAPRVQAKLDRMNKKRTGALARARGVIQATMVRAEAEGTEDVGDDNAGLIAGYVWHVNHFSPKICDRCLARDKKWYPSIKEKPPLHKFCYCSSNASARSPESLGMGAVPGPLSVRPFGEWVLQAGVPYDGGLAALPMRTRGKWKVRLPRAARVNKPPVGWDTGARYGQESDRQVGGGQSLLETNPYHEPAGSPIGGRFAHGPGGATFFGNEEEHYALEYNALTQSSQKWESLLSPAEKVAVGAYTGGAGGSGAFHVINSNIAAGRLGDTEQHLISAIKKAPVITDRACYRGIKAGMFSSLSRMREEFERSVGTVITWKTLVSTSIDPEIGAGFGQFVFVIRSKKGRYINAATKHGDEYEAVFLPGSKFRVMWVGMIRIRTEYGNIVERVGIRLEDG